MKKRRNLFNAEKLNLWNCCGEYYPGGITHCRKCGKPRLDASSSERSTPKPQQSQPDALDAKSQVTEALGNYSGRLRIVIERHSNRMLDDDNAIGGAKQLRDAIAHLLDRKGDSEQDGLTFEYIQVKSKAKKTVIKFYKI
jgi:hypothetical protein